MNGADNSHKSQCSRILGVLIAARGAWVPLWEITPLAAQYNSRLYSLRRLGFKIENKTELLDGVRHSWFRLISSPSPRTTSADSPIGAAAPTNSTSREIEETLPLFPGDRS